MVFFRRLAYLGLLVHAHHAGIHFNYSDGDAKSDRLLKAIKKEFNHTLIIHEHTSEEAKVVFVDNSGVKKEYEGDIDRTSVINFLKEMVFGKVKSSTERDHGQKPSKASGKSDKNANTGQTANSGERKVLALDESNFDKLVMGSTKPVFVKFYAPWCGHCKAMEDDWKKLAKQVDPDAVIIAEVNADAEKSLAHRFGVRGFPTLKLFPGGKKSMNKIIEYDQNDRSLKAFFSFIKKHVKGAQGSIKQLTSQSMFEKTCSKEICMITFLPHILDSSVDERKNYIKILNKVRGETSDLPIRHFWTEASNSVKLEEFFRLGFGWPATIIVNDNKKVFAVHKGRTQVKDLVDFANGVSIGKYSVDPFKVGEAPQWPDLEPWSAQSDKRGEL